MEILNPQQFTQQHLTHTTPNSSKLSTIWELTQSSEFWNKLEEMQEMQEGSLEASAAFPKS